MPVTFGVMEKVQRSPGASLLLCAATIVAGLSVRFASLHLPPVVVKYGGSGLWALLWYWVVTALLPRWRIATAALAAGGLATAVELFKLYRSPGMDAFRHTLPGILLLGRIFSARDLLAYWAAIMAGAWIDRRLRLGKTFAEKKEDTA